MIRDGQVVYDSYAIEAIRSDDGSIVYWNEGNTMWVISHISATMYLRKYKAHEARYGDKAKEVRAGSIKVIPFPGTKASG